MASATSQDARQDQVQRLLVENQVLRREANELRQRLGGASRRETQNSIGDWADQTFGAVRPTGWERIFQKFTAEVVELRDALKSGDSFRVPEELADCAILLYRLAQIRGINLEHCVDDKMQVNRQRRWTTKGDGTGEHIQSGKVPDAHLGAARG